MAGVLLSLLSATLSTIGDMKMTSLSVSSGSSLKLPTNCSFDPSNHYELHVTDHLIGSYSDHYLMPRLKFSKRLQFDQGNCTFILKNLTEEDSNVYTFITTYDKKTRIQLQVENFNISVTGYVAPVPPLNNLSPHHEDNVCGFVAACFLLDPLMAAITMSIYRLILWYVEKFPGSTPPCLRQISSFLVDLFQNVVNSGFEFSEWFSLGSQLLGTVLFIVWKVHGHEHSVMWPIFSAIGFIIEVVIKCSRYLCTCLQLAVQYCPRYLMLFRPLLTSGSIVVAFSATHKDITMTRKMWYLWAAMASLMIRLVLIAFLYWKSKNKNEKNNEDSNTDPNSLLGGNQNL
ncbi:uncharacterized protein [Ranitomeya imitator]|uniref:uncharacterized protein isoform X2 n=1 Tax=Ranitomeya imitator TaxID=111125 RepID=UPI0037E8D93F